MSSMTWAIRNDVGIKDAEKTIVEVPSPCCFNVSVHSAEEPPRAGGCVWLTGVRSGQEADDYIGEAAVARQAARMMLEVTHACKRVARGWQEAGCECGWVWCKGRRC